MVSFAQNHEDVLLERCFRDQKEGFYVDVGAWDPTEDSVTRHFYDRGWSGLNVEPVAEYFERLQAQRPRDINVQCVVGDEIGTRRFTVIKGSGLSTSRELDVSFLEELDRGGYTQEIVDVPETTLAALCKAHVPEGVEIDFLKVDVEGFEVQVLHSGDWNVFRPRVLVVESMQPVAFDIAKGSPVVEDSSQAWEPYLLTNGYLFASTDGINRFYVRSEEKDLLKFFATPVNVLDYYVPFDTAAARQELAAQKQEAQEAVDELRRIADELRAELDEAREMVTQLERRCAAGENEIASLLASTSWRSTAPLRAVTGWMRKNQ